MIVPKFVELSEIERSRCTLSLCGLYDKAQFEEMLCAAKKKSEETGKPYALCVVHLTNERIKKANKEAV